MKASSSRWSLPSSPTAALDALRAAPGGAEAALIGEVHEQPAAAVLVTTRYGGSRIVDMLVGRSAPQDLLGGRWRSPQRLPVQVEEKLLAAESRLRALLRAGGAASRTRVPRDVGAFPARRAPLAFGRGPYATDAQHVSVEFVHPVIVGKRALPALDLSLDFGPWLEALVQPDDMVMGFGPPEGDPEVAAALRRRRAPRRHDVRAARRRGRVRRLAG